MKWYDELVSKEKPTGLRPKLRRALIRAPVLIPLGFLLGSGFEDVIAAQQLGLLETISPSAQGMTLALQEGMAYVCPLVGYQLGKRWTNIAQLVDGLIYVVASSVDEMHGRPAPKFDTQS